VAETLRDYKNTSMEKFSYDKTKLLINKAISLYSSRLAKLVREQMLLDEIESNRKERVIKL